LKEELAALASDGRARVAQGGGEQVKNGLGPIFEDKINKLGKYKYSTTIAQKAGDPAFGDRESILAIKLAEEAVQMSGKMTWNSRSATVREHCLRHHGSICACCKIDFGARYGEKFKNLIDVHHLNPLENGSRITNPETDCVPLCPNCHRMAHFGMSAGKCRDVEDLKPLVAPTR
jgi:predicted HNH restriction endonuclease